MGFECAHLAIHCLEYTCGCFASPPLLLLCQVLLAALAPPPPSYTGRFFRAGAESRRRELGDEGDAALLIPRMRLRPHLSSRPPPPLRKRAFLPRSGKTYL
jgi:hypothetical protein